MFLNIMEKITNINFYTFSITIFGVLFLNYGRDYLSAPFKTKFGIPLPMELCWVILMIILSLTFNIQENFNVTIVNHIPTGYLFLKNMLKF